MNSEKYKRKKTLQGNKEMLQNEKKKIVYLSEWIFWKFGLRGYDIQVYEYHKQVIRVFPRIYEYRVPKICLSIVRSWTDSRKGGNCGLD